VTLVPGTKLGPYEIVHLLGEGGMGEVYRARDPRLGRDVAIKVLPATLSRDPERIARFEREARLLAVMSHAGIAAIYGEGGEDATRSARDAGTPLPTRWRVGASLGTAKESRPA